MSKKDTRTVWEQELDERIRCAAEAEDRLDEPLTRREVLEAIEHVRERYSGSGFTDQDLIADAFRKLAKALS